MLIAIMNILYFILLSIILQIKPAVFLRAIGIIVKKESSLFKKLLLILFYKYY